jgi:tryptophanyl-tRNA synthetase
MHTSYGNAIFLRDNPEETKRKVMSMYTDPTRIHTTDPGHVEGNPVFDYLDIFCLDKEEVSQHKVDYRAGGIGDVALKGRLAEVLNQYLTPLRERREAFYAQPRLLMEVLYSGTDKARSEARRTLEEVYEKMGLLYSQDFLMKIPSPNVSGAFC